MHSISINQSSDDFQVVSGVWMNMQGVFMGHVLTADKGGVLEVSWASRDVYVAKSSRETKTQNDSD